MPWLEVNLVVDQSKADNISEALETAGALAVTMQNSGEGEVLEPGVGETSMWQQVQVTGLFSAGIDQLQVQQELSSLGIIGHAGELQFSELADQQWERSWLDRFQPMCFGKRLWIYPSHTKPPDSDNIILRLDPGLAFGTGTHATTALCLHWMDGAQLDGSTVVDYGCGSGILAIAAGLLGAERVIAVDNDPQALLATRDNAARNGVAGLIETVEPGAFDASDVDLVLANILSQPLIDLAPALKACLADGGRLVLSGILENQADSVQAAYVDSIHWQKKSVESGWVRLCGIKGMNEQILEKNHD